MPRSALSALRRAAAPLLASSSGWAPAAAQPFAAAAALPPALARGALTAAAAAKLTMRQQHRHHRLGCACGACAAAAAAAVTAAAPTGDVANSNASAAWRAQGGAVRHSHCNCPGLDGPQPDRVLVEYDPDDVELFIQVADAIEEALPGVIVEGNPEADGRPGSFEVVAPSGAVVFSRLGSAAGAPQPAAIVAALSALSAEGGACATTAAGGGGAAGGAA